MKEHENQLPLPPKASGDSQARELARIWAADGSQHVVIATGLWKDPASWGLMLVDLMKHAAEAYNQTTEISYAQALNRIKEGFDVECESDGIN